ncbi:CoA transferase [Cupriavidus pinatubonensis]|uniref:CaiB/BaiF CoA transferase family protein n=1 Tax=Cupriavidus pinatubonensis TaxID=248026 RepID=UPI001128970D|nr:CoA transferase [Cupriavidus pinatubonensis]QYY28529.1 CoA transferase [Cupriavidus pinatubonensis]TPQ38059.1 CoA transferase [Cupriavidus pinatubonensis]
MNSSELSFAPLSGIRVLDFSHVIAGPLATFYLAQLGATVLKMENANGGDVMRRTEKGRQGFVALNAGKQSHAVDLGNAADLARALEMAATCDVVVDNLRPGVLERFGLGFEAIRAVNPKVVYCTISGYGQHSGDVTGRPAYDHVIQAATGMAFMAGTEDDPPIKTGFPVVDAATGMQAALAILAGLRERDRLGCAVQLDVSMTGAALQLMYSFACEALTSGTTPPRVGNQGYSGSPTADFFATEDGWIALGANTPRQLMRLLEVLDLSHLASDPAYFAEPLDPDTPVSFVRSVDPARLKAVIADRVRTLGAEDLEHHLGPRGVPAAKVRKLGEFATEAQRHGRVSTVMLKDEDASVISPGLGFGVRTHR